MINDLVLGQVGLSCGYLLLILIAIIMAFCVAKVRLRYRLILMPIFIFYVIVMFCCIPKIMGWATPLPVPGKEMALLGLTRSAEEGKKEQKMYLWLLDEKKPRAYSMPFDAKFYQKLQEAIKQAQQSGEWIYIKNNSVKEMKQAMDGMGGQQFNESDIEDTIQVIVKKPHEVIKKEE